MAEGMLRHLAGDRYEAFSAGTVATGLRPEAISAMAEIGVDISAQSSKTLERYLGEPFELVVTVCDAAREACPTFPGAARVAHWDLDDPSTATGTDEDRMAVYRHVRDEIERRVRELVGC